jgi:zinc transport system permease protein
MAVIAAIVGLCSIISGLSASFYWNTPTGPTMIAAAIVLFVITSLWSVANRGR